MSNKLGIWIIGAMVAGLGLIGLFLSAHADDGVMHLSGLLIAGFAVLFVFGLIGGHADMAEASTTGEGADRAGHDEEIRPLAAEIGVGAAELVDATVEPGEIDIRPLDQRTDAVV